MNDCDDIGDCPSDFGLERWRLGELDGSPTAHATARHVEHCPMCATRIAAMAEPPAPLPLDAVWQSAHRAGRGENRGLAPTPMVRPRRARVLAGLSVVLTAAAVVALWLQRPAPRADVVKGGPWTMKVLVKRRGKEDVAPVSSGVRLAAGDRLRFEASTTWSVGYAAIIGLDSLGVVSALVPSGGQAIEIAGGRPVLLDGAAELDDAPGSERIDLLACPRRMAVTSLVAQARAALARGGGNLRKLGQMAPGCYQETFWIEKVAR